MSVNCPACGYYNPQGQQTCFHCSLPLPISAAIDALCAVHPEVKAVGACSRCGTFGCGGCLTARGSDWLCAQCLQRVGQLPWDERETLGLWRAWWRTSVLMISSPGVVLSTAQPDAPLGSSMLFVLLSTIAGFVPTLVTGALFMIPGMIFGSASDTSPGRLGPLGAAGIGVFVLLFYGVGIFVYQLGGALFLAAIDHLALMVLGAEPKSYTVTLRAQALSTGPYLVGLLPMCSIYVFPLWALVLRIIGVMYLHKTTAGKATAAVLLPTFLMCGGFAGLYFGLIALAMAGGR